MKLTTTQIEMLHNLAGRQATFYPFGLEIGTCKALAKRGLAIFDAGNGIGGRRASITDAGREWLAEHDREKV